MMTPKHRRQRAEPRSAARADDEKPKAAPAKVLPSDPDPDPVKKADPRAKPAAQKETK